MNWNTWKLVPWRGNKPIFTFLLVANRTCIAEFWISPSTTSINVWTAMFIAVLWASWSLAFALKVFLLQLSVHILIHASHSRNVFETLWNRLEVVSRQDSTGLDQCIQLTPYEAQKKKAQSHSLLSSVYRVCSVSSARLSCAQQLKLQDVRTPITLARW